MKKENGRFLNKSSLPAKLRLSNAYVIIPWNGAGIIFEVRNSPPKNQDFQILRNLSMLIESLHHFPGKELVCYRCIHLKYNEALEFLDILVSHSKLCNLKSLSPLNNQI